MWISEDLEILFLITFSILDGSENLIMTAVL